MQDIAEFERNNLKLTSKLECHINLTNNKLNKNDKKFDECLLVNKTSEENIIELKNMLEPNENNI